MKIEKTIDIGKLRSLGEGIDILIENRSSNRVRVELHVDSTVADPGVVRAAKAVCPEIIVVDARITLTRQREVG